MKRNLPGVVGVATFAVLTTSLYVASVLLPGPSYADMRPSQGGQAGHALAAANLSLILLVTILGMTIDAWEGWPRRKD